MRLPFLSLLVLLTACGGGGTTAPRPTGGGTPTTPPASSQGPGIPAGPYVPGQVYEDSTGYIEYVAGNAPVILTAPHGGRLTPSEIRDRTCGTNTFDTNTQELAREMQRAYLARYGQYPHVIINRLARIKLDANRDSAEATCGNVASARAWRAWHAFVGVARAAVLASKGKGWYLDLHGHGHAKQRLELGYLLTNAQLDLGDAALDASTGLADASSVRTMVRYDAGRSFSALLRGPRSLGALYEAEGFPSIPSPTSPSPKGDDYFDGGFNTQLYGCRDGGPICGVQIESNFTGVRDSPASWTRFAEATARILGPYLQRELGLTLTP